MKNGSLETYLTTHQDVTEVEKLKFVRVLLVLPFGISLKLRLLTV